MENRDITEMIEKGLGSPGKLKILKLLLDNQDQMFTRYQIGKKVPLRPTHIRSDLKALVDVGLVKELRVEPRRYSINLEDNVVKELRKFFRAVKYCR